MAAVWPVALISFFERDLPCYGAERRKRAQQEKTLRLFKQFADKSVDAPGAGEAQGSLLLDVLLLEMQRIRAQRIQSESI